LKILITGGNGFIGSYLVDELIRRNYETYILDNHFPGFGNKQRNEKAIIINGDIRNYEHVDFATKNMDVVIHLAALSHVTTCRDNPRMAVEVNVCGTTNILDACLKNKVKRVIVAGTDHVYGNDLESISLKETEPHQGLIDDMYASTKTMSVAITRLYNKLYGLGAIITISGNVFGERQSKPNAIPNFIDAALNNKDITIFGDGKQTRDFYHIDNLVEGYIKCIETPNIEGEIFNFGAEKETSIVDLATTIKQLCNSKSKIIFKDADISTLGMRRMLLCTDKAKQKLGYKLIVSFEDGLKKTIDEIKKI